MTEDEFGWMLVTAAFCVFEVCVTLAICIDLVMDRLDDFSRRKHGLDEEQITK